MNELATLSFENRDISTWDFTQLRTELQRGLDYYAKIVYTDDSIRDAKKDRALLNKVKKAIEDARKDYRNKCLEPYKLVEPQLKELVDMVEEQRLLIDSTVKDYETRQKDIKEQAVRDYYNKKSMILGALADRLYPKLLDPKWLNANTTRLKYQEGVQLAISGAHRDLKAIKEMNSMFTDFLVDVYVDTLSMDAVKEKEAELTKIVQSILPAVHNEQIINNNILNTVFNEQATDTSVEGVTMKIYADSKQMNQITDFMKAIGVKYELV